MRSKQQGVSLGGLLLVLFVVVIVGIFSLKLIGPYMEYFKIKAAIEAIAAEKKTSVGDIRKSFDARATIDDIETIKGSDLEITKDGNDVVISFGYRKEVPLVKNVGLFIDFTGSSRPD